MIDPASTTTSFIYDRSFIFNTPTFRKNEFRVIRVQLRDE